MVRKPDNQPGRRPPGRSRKAHPGVDWAGLDQEKRSIASAASIGNRDNAVELHYWAGCVPARSPSGEVPYALQETGPERSSGTFADKSGYIQFILKEDVNNEGKSCFLTAKPRRRSTDDQTLATPRMLHAVVSSCHHCERSAPDLSCELLRLLMQRAQILPMRFDGFAYINLTQRTM